MYRVLLCAFAASTVAASLALAEPLSPPPFFEAEQAAPEQPQPRYAAARGPFAFLEAIFGGPAEERHTARPAPYGQPDYSTSAYASQRDEASAESDTGRSPIDPRFRRQLVDYAGREPAGTLIIDTRQFHLYLVQGGGKAIRYGVGVGRPGFTWSGVHAISAKREWPDWVPPEQMVRRQPMLPRFVAGGPHNPLGARALYLGSTLYRIHGSNEPWTIGTRVSSGCIRMRNEDVIDLYDRVRVGARVVVI
jgi:lipoprotein-anchoring transpeptidase ErfK/SrfK